ncbi:hypothetical protein Vadar_003716 [Vaccinium darrowii]|uniref:Uncharacterized protein n=1 Tax=Vaccinium darrowii TaxID=229202 RepID=A0ACB7YCJ7_9ERIC|nr:hypothetical protein Vadar_003716 [Vaccinium darrowii]
MAMMFEEQSVGWNSTPPPTSSSFPSTADSVVSFQNPISPPPQANQRQFASGESRSKKEDICFTCKKEGHWVKDCPMKSPNPPTEDFPIVHCLCGAPCVVKVSRTAENPGRKFYTCPLPREKQCRFFKWCKGATSDVNIKTPICKCSAGPCRIYTETNEQGVSSKFFVCPIKKGQGACSFIQPVVPVNNFLDERLLNSENNLLDKKAVFASKEVACLEEIDSSSSQVDGGEAAHLMGTSFVQPGKNPDSATSTISKVGVPFGLAAFGKASSVGVGGMQEVSNFGNDVAVMPGVVRAVATPFGSTMELVVSSLPEVARRVLASPCESTGEVVAGSIMEERDGNFVVVRQDDGSVVLKREGESVTIKLEYFDGVEDSYKQRVLYIFRIHPSTFVGLGALSPFARRYVLGEFGRYLELLDSMKLSIAHAQDLDFLHKKLISLKNDGLEVWWLLDRNEHLVAQLEAVRWRDKVEQVGASLKIAIGTVAHLEGVFRQVEENLGKAKALVASLKEEEAFCVEKLNAASELTISEFDLDGSAGQGLSD